MYIIRPIRKNDLDAYEHLAITSSPGMVNLPKNRRLLKIIIEESLASFQNEVKTPRDETYLFVLENTVTGEIGGTSAIMSRAGVKHPLLYFKIKQEPSASEPVSYLQPEIEQNGASEICGLFLKHDFRHTGLGRLLSLSRFMFIAAFRERFQKEIFAEMRGFCTAEHENPFWNGIGKHFLAIDYLSLLKLAETDHEKIKKAFPRFPIYISLLPDDVQETIGKIHPKTVPAMQMLKSEGFSEINEVDFFDGGPHVGAKTENIRTIKESALATMEISENPLDTGTLCMLANELLDFRVCQAFVNINSHRRSLTIDKNTAEKLLLRKGDSLRYLPLET